MTDVDDKRIYDYYVAGRASAALAVAVRLGVFDRLDLGAASASELASAIGCPLRPTSSLLEALRGMGLLEARAEEPVRYALATDAAAYLVRGKPEWLGGLIELEVDGFLSPALLLEAMRRDGPVVYGADDPWEAHDADPARAAAFTAAMHSISARPARALASAPELAPWLADRRRLLDVGGGSGALSIALAEAWPELACTIFDRASVLPAARAYLDASAARARLDTLAGDMFAPPWPAGYDAVLLSQILHDWPIERGRALLASALEALAPGGVCLVHEKLVEADGGPLANALVHLDMLVWTEGRQLGVSELIELFEEAGFVDVRRVRTTGYWSVVVGRAPSDQPGGGDSE